MNSNQQKLNSNENWKVGDKVIHELFKQFGAGEITHVFGSGNKIALAIKFSDVGQKMIDPAVAQLQKIE